MDQLSYLRAMAQQAWTEVHRAKTRAAELAWERFAVALENAVTECTKLKNRDWE